MLRAIFLLIAITLPGVAQVDVQRLLGIYDHTRPGIAILVRKHSRTEYTLKLGLRDLRTKGAIDSRTNFRLASVTKQFTATAIMLLIKDGKLRYDTRLTDVFPDFPAYAHEITIRHLLNHTSGLPDYEELMDHAGKEWTAEDQISDAEVFELLKRAPSPKFAPGTKWSYSNSGYVLLCVIAA